MLNTSQIIAAQTDMIMTQWMIAVHQERQIQSSENLPDTALGDSLPQLLKSLAALLEKPHEDLFERIVQASLTHGTLRAKQGYDAAEIAKEYSLLRRTIFSVLEPHFLDSSPRVILQDFCQINTVLDEAISLCFKSYVQERLQELEQLQTQLIWTNQELTRLFEASKDNFSSLAHELKAPITAVIGYSELLLRLQQQKLNPESDSLNIRSIEHVLQGGRHLLHLVNDSLEISRYEANQINLNLEWSDVRSIVTKVSEMLEPLAQAKGLQLKVDGESAPERVFTDPFRLQQILTNLLSNAIRYTDAGSIQVTCQNLSDQKWSISVTDTGIGIAAKDQAYIFEPFSQAFFNQGRRQPESTGLGLAIVSRLVQLLRGEIHLASELGVGSTFTVTLPLDIQT